MRAIDETLALWGRLDALFNAAGISGRRFGDGPVADCSEEGWRTVIDANLTSIFLAAACRAGAAGRRWRIDRQPRLGARDGRRRRAFRNPCLRGEQGRDHRAQPRDGQLLRATDPGECGCAQADRTNMSLRAQGDPDHRRASTSNPLPAISACRRMSPKRSCISPLTKRVRRAWCCPWTADGRRDEATKAVCPRAGSSVGKPERD